MALAGALPKRARHRRGGAAALLACALLVVGGCANEPSTPGVANVSTASRSSSGSPGKPAATDLVAYAKCMRDNGIANFPDPGPNGGIDLSAGDGLDPNSPQFKAAQKKCAGLQPSGGAQPNAEQDKEIQQKFLDFAKCMRKNGIADYPDPKPKSDGGIDLSVPASIDVNSPQFKAAEKKCESLQPGGGPSVTGGGS
jgi:hypothetical protein